MLKLKISHMTFLTQKTTSIRWIKVIPFTCDSNRCLFIVYCRKYCKLLQIAFCGIWSYRSDTCLLICTNYCNVNYRVIYTPPVLKFQALSPCSSNCIWVYTCESNWVYTCERKTDEIHVHVPFQANVRFCNILRKCSVL